MEAQPTLVPWRYQGLSEKMRVVAPSAEYLANHLAQPDRLAILAATSAEQPYMAERREQAAEGDATNTHTSPSSTVVSKKRTAAASGLQESSSKRHATTSSVAVDKEQRKPKNKQRLPHARREAAAKVVTKFMHSKSPKELMDMITSAGMEIYLLDVEDLRKTTVAKESKKWDPKTLQRTQLHFHLGRAFMSVYDDLVATANKNRNYGTGFCQWLLQGKDVVVVGNLAKAMSEPGIDLLPVDGSSVGLDKVIIRKLMDQIKAFEVKVTDGKGFWPIATFPASTWKCVFTELLKPPTPVFMSERNDSTPGNSPPREKMGGSSTY